jgi:hypothetical protein
MEFFKDLNLSEDAFCLATSSFIVLIAKLTCYSAHKKRLLKHFNLIVQGANQSAILSFR